MSGESKGEWELKRGRRRKEGKGIGRKKIGERLGIEERRKKKIKYEQVYYI